MRERWVDGFNVLHKMGDLAALLERDAEAAREEFLRRLAPLVFRGRERWTIIFDGPIATRDQAPGPIRVIFARDADAWILAELNRVADPRSVTVVSSDEKDIGIPARARGAAVENAESLLQRLSRFQDAKSGPEKPDRSTPEEIDFWLDQFGGADSGEPRGEL